VKCRILLVVLYEYSINFLTHTTVSSYKTNLKTNYNKSACPQNRKKKLNKRVTSAPRRPIEGAVRFSLSLKVVQENLIGPNLC